MGKIEISGTGLPGGTAVRLDGQDIARGLRGLTFTLDAGRASVLELDVAVCKGVELDVEDAHVCIPDATRELLVRLGWVPPATEPVL